MNRRTLLSLALCSFPLCLQAASSDLKIFIWPEYLPKSVVEKFEKEADAKLVVEEYTSNEDLISKVADGGSGYDLVCPSDYAVTTMIRQDLLIKLDVSKIPNLSNLAARFQSPKYDEGGPHVVPYLVGTSGIGYNKTKVPAPPKSWADLYNPEKLGDWKGKLSIIDDPKEGPASALLTLGLDINTTKEADLDKALALLMKQKPFLGSYDSETFEDTLLKGETVLAQGYSGDFAAALKENKDLDYVIPAEGCVVSIDNLAILKDSKNVALALKFLDFICRPEIAAEIANETGYIPTNGKAEGKIKPEVKGSPTFKLPVPEKSFSLKDLGSDGEDARAELWTKLKAE
jgi:spermidine/putrescine transport system substrate-binding protein